MRWSLPVRSIALGVGMTGVLVASASRPTLDHIVGASVPTERSVETGLLVLDGTVVRPPIRLVATNDFLTANRYVIYEVMSGLATAPAEPSVLISRFAGELVAPDILVALQLPVVIDDDFFWWLDIIGVALAKGQLVIVCGAQRPEVMSVDLGSALTVIQMYRDCVSVPDEVLRGLGLEQLRKYERYFQNPRPLKRTG